VEPSFSVVVPTKGRPRYLTGCLAAMARLRPPSGGFEVVVVNDGGGPETDAVVSAAPASLRARAVTSAGDGPSAARNAGAAVAAGEYLAFTDDDCEPEPGWLVEFQRALAADPAAGLGGTTVNGAVGNPGAVATQIVFDALHAHFNRAPGAPRFFDSINLALPTETFRDIGGFDERFRTAEAREFCLRWIEGGHRLRHAPAAVVNHMRTLSLGQFLRQHHGYGRGAWAFRRARGGLGSADSVGVVRGIFSGLHRSDPRAGRSRVGAYLVLSQLVTASGFAREAAASMMAGESRR
jgi:glycosyltransferase involved in cell wall biosynthesis